MIIIHTDLICDLAENICVKSVFAEMDALRSHFLAHAENIDFFQLIEAVIDLIDHDLIQ